MDSTIQDLDHLYDRIDNHLLSKEFELVDDMLFYLNPKNLSIDIILGWLTITFAAANHLPSRKLFYYRAVEWLLDSGQYDSLMLNGLD